MAVCDVDYFRLSVSFCPLPPSPFAFYASLIGVCCFKVRSPFVASQLSWRLSSGYDRVNFDTAGLLEVASTPTLLYVPQEAKTLLYEEVKLQMEGARAHPSTNVFLLNARTMSGDDLLTALLAAGIEVRPPS
jgi:hypothetical protein